jgi:hypothetical protein
MPDCASVKVATAFTEKAISVPSSNHLYHPEVVERPRAQAARPILSSNIATAVDYQVPTHWHLD